MRILALEFSTAQRSVAIVSGGDAHQPLLTSEVVETGGPATRALGMVEEALFDAQIGRAQVERIVVGVGPGSYTGIRAAIALAQGWQLARDIQLLGISSVAAIAAQAHSDGLVGPVAVVIDAQRGEFYLVAYELTAAGWHERSPLRLATLSEVQAVQASGHLLIGPEVTKWFPAGRVIFPRAAVLGRLAFGRTDVVPGEKLEPIYLRQTTFVKAPPPRVLPP